MNVMDIMKECVKNSNNSQNVKAIVTLDNGKEYKLRGMCELECVEKSREALFFGMDGSVCGGYTDGEKDEDEDGRVHFYIKKNLGDMISLSIPERFFFGWAYASDYKINIYLQTKNIINKSLEKILKRQ